MNFVEKYIGSQYVDIFAIVLFIRFILLRKMPNNGRILDTDYPNKSTKISQSRKSFQRKTKQN